MPHFDEGTYSDKRCYNTKEAELGKNTPTLPPRSTLQKREAEAIGNYVLTKFVGRGAATKA